MPTRAELPMCADCGSSASLEDLGATCSCCGRGIIITAPAHNMSGDEPPHLNDILEAADLTMVDLIYFTAAMETLVPPEGRPRLSVDTVGYLTWEAASEALDKWAESDHLSPFMDVINKIREAAESLTRGE